MSEKNFVSYGDAETLFTGIGNSRPSWDELSDNITMNTIPKKDAGTYTHNGITYVVDSDGKITANGTASSSANSLFTVTTAKFKSGKRYWLTGCPTGGGNNAYFIICGDGTNNVREYGSGTYFTATANDTVIQIVVAKGVTVTDLVFEPMLVLEKYKGESFVSHVPSNKELAESTKVVDEVTNGNMHPVTSNAVFNAIANRLKGGAAYGTVNYNGKTYFVPEIYEENLADTSPCVLLVYVLGENNAMAIVAVDYGDVSGFSYVEGQINNFEKITVDGERYNAIKMSDDEDVDVYVMYLGKAW